MSDYNFFNLALMFGSTHQGSVGRAGLAATASVGALEPRTGSTWKINWGNTCWTTTVSPWGICKGFWVIWNLHFLHKWPVASLWSSGKCLHLQRTWVAPILGIYWYAVQWHPLTWHGRVRGRSGGTSSKSVLCCLYLDKVSLLQKWAYIYVWDEM